MTTTIDIRELPQRLNEAMEAVAAGSDVIIADGLTPRARLVPIASAPRLPGLHPGAMITSPDFDAALPDDFWTGRS